MLSPFENITVFDDDKAIRCSLLTVAVMTRDFPDKIANSEQLTVNSE